MKSKERTETHAESHACDLISRQAAIDGKICIQQSNGVEIYDDYAVPVEYLKQLPPAQPELKWIPCCERLPKKDGRYQVTRHDYVTNTEFIDILWYEKNLWWNRQFTGDYAVIAWMPLPEPYKEGGAG